MKTDILKTIAKIHKESKEVIAWYNFKDVLYKTTLNLKTYKKDKFELIFAVHPDEMFWLKQMISGDDKINFYAPSESIAFCSEFIELGEDYLRCKIPNEIMEFDRREGKRVHPETLITMYIQNEELGKSYNCFEIGINGFSILLRQNDRKKYNISEKHRVIINLLKTQIICDCEIVNSYNLRPFSIEKDPYARKRVSFKIVSIEESDKNMLSDFIIGHSQIFKSTV